MPCKTAKIIENDLYCPVIATGYKAIDRAYTRTAAFIYVIYGYNKSLFSMVLAFASGAVGRGGSTDVAIIIVAVLIIVPSISAANAPLLKQGNIRDSSPCPVLSEMFRSASCFFFSAVVSLSTQRNYNPGTEYPNFQHLATYID